MLPRRPPNPLPIALLVLVLFAVGCATRPLSGVSVKNLTSDLVFGIPPLPEAVAPPNTLPEPEGSSVRVSEGDFGVFRPRQRGDAAPDPCPVAPVGSAPFESVPNSIDRPPSAGTYTYRYVISQPKSGLVFEGSELRGIGNIRPREDVNRNDPDTARFDYTFTLTQELQTSGTALQIISATVFGVDQSSRGAPASGPSVFTGENPRGIYLLSIEKTTTENGKSKISRHNANPPIKYMTLPGVIGAEGAFSTTSVDPTTQEVISLEGETVHRQPIDACGEMIDTWYMHATQRVTPASGPTVETKLEYGIATQLGGMIVVEHIEVPSASPDRILDFVIGSIAPK